MNKDPHIVKGMDSVLDLDAELINETFAPNHSSFEHAEDNVYEISMEDEENMGCLIESRPENDVIDLCGNKIIDDL
tara:strand:- start:165 stop:392 length:228 start_codon:yes stop_codon:yes gene_type:complete